MRLAESKRWEEKKKIHSERRDRVWEERGSRVEEEGVWEENKKPGVAQGHSWRWSLWGEEREEERNHRRTPVCFWLLINQPLLLIRLQLCAPQRRRKAGCYIIFGEGGTRERWRRGKWRGQMQSCDNMKVLSADTSAASQRAVSFQQKPTFILPPEGVERQRSSHPKCSPLKLDSIPLLVTLVYSSEAQIPPMERRKAKQRNLFGKHRVWAQAGRRV